MGLFGGFLGWEAYDERLPESEKHLMTAGIHVTITICDIQADHPNTYKIRLKNSKETRNLTAISTGGGMIEVIEIDGVSVSMAGDYFETLIYCSQPEDIMAFLKASIAYDDIVFHKARGIICDPIGNRVEAPCLGRNVMAATNAVSCANMALSDYAQLIPLDEVIDTMKAVGDQIHHTLRCTNLGGLSITKAAKQIEAMLEEQPNRFFKSC